MTFAIEAYDLPDGAELIVGPIKTTFKCPEKYGYWADVDNDCKIFHICHPVDYPDGELTAEDSADCIHVYLLLVRFIYYEYSLFP